MCEHLKAVTKRYVGSAETYEYCPECGATWGGEETPAKRALIAGAVLAAISEEDETDAAFREADALTSSALNDAHRDDAV